MKLRNKKTGLVWNVWSFYDGNQTINLKYFNNDGQVNLEYNSLADLNKDWEDYKPAEPLIKDPKIRKAVRAWAEANGIKEIIIFDHINNAPYTPVGAVYFAQNSGHLEIRFRTEERFDTDRIYTIGELCGEEKPRPVIVGDIKYSSYEDYLKSKGKK